MLKSFGVLLLVLFPIVYLAKNKTHNLPTAVGIAARVYVQADDFDARDSSRFFADGRAIANVQSALRDWKRYAVTTQRDQAELVFIVHKGHRTSAEMNSSVDQSQPSANGSGSPFGSPDCDSLRVYLPRPGGQLMRPVWSGCLIDGLEFPQMTVFKQFRSEVDSAYPIAAVTPRTTP